MKNYNFLTNKKTAFIISAVLLVAGLISFIVLGFNFGVDFSGGSKITMQLETKPTDADLDKIEEIVIDEVGKDNFVSLIKSSANPKTVIATVKSVVSFDNRVRAALASLYGVSEEELGDKNLSSDGKYAYFTFKSKADVKEADLKKALNDLDDDVEDGVFKSVSKKDGSVTVNYFSTSIEDQVINRVNELNPVVEEDVSTISKNRAAAQTKTALIAAAVAIILMLVYITIRFKQIASGFASVICLFFNLFVMFMFYAIFRWEMTLDIIPACLTILGYSINATIVIFDRIRENLKDAPTFEAAADSGVHSTLLRSINTTITTLITIVLVYILGVESIKAFALPLIIGILAGLFSSVFLSAPLWAVLKKKDGADKEAA